MEKGNGGGALFKAKQKTHANQPDYRGNIEMSAAFLKELYAVAKGSEGGIVKAELSAWLKKSKNGVSYMGLQLQKPYRREETADGPAPQTRGGGSGRSLDDDIPF
jgi:hypothetical protein